MLRTETPKLLKEIIGVIFLTLVWAMIILDMSSLNTINISKNR
jgi:hypothetical protein